MFPIHYLSQTGLVMLAGAVQVGIHISSLIRTSALDDADVS